MKHSRTHILQVLEQNRERIQAIGVRRLGLFGSCARDEGSASSDIDFLVDFADKTFDNYMDLKWFLESLFGCQVDLVVADAVKPRLSDRIHREAVYAPGL